MCHREEKDDVEFNFLEFTGLVSIFRKNKMKNAPFPKTSLLVQIGEEMRTGLL